VKRKVGANDVDKERFAIMEGHRRRGKKGEKETRLQESKGMTTAAKAPEDSIRKDPLGLNVRNLGDLLGVERKSFREKKEKRIPD